MEEVRSSILLSSTTQDRDRGTSLRLVPRRFRGREGCFSVTRKLPPYADGDPRLRFVFVVQVARRDRHLLEGLQRTLACGSIHEKPPARDGWQPTSVFTVSGIRSHRKRVIPFMDRHLLGGHKRHQFELWVQAMDAYELAHPSRWGKGPSTCRIEGCDRPVARPRAVPVPLLPGDRPLMAMTVYELAEFLGGVVAAEGTFVRSFIRGPSGNRRPTFTFAVGLGASDAGTCHLLQSFLGVGQVRRYPRRKAHFDDEVVYAIRSIDLLVSVVVPFMDDHLPPSHKREQYLAWRAELLAYDAVRLRRPRR